MFGFTGTTTFGQPAQQPAPAFGAQPASPFGGTFGQPAQQPASPFGGASAPLFGAQSPAPAFGQAAPAAAPAFGTTTGTTGFGTGAFGAAAKPAGFGGFGTTTTAAPNPFGAPTQTTGGFGAPAQSAPAFGAGLGSAPSFGATLAPAPAFGATTTPAFGAPQSAPSFGGFGAASAPAFGAPAAAPANPFGATTTGFGATAAPAFGAAPAATGFGAPAAGAAAPFGTTTTNLFGTPAATPSPFGGATAQPAAGFGGFGAAPAGAPTAGTRNVPYTKTKDPDAPAGQPTTFLISMSALPNFQPPNISKSHEELRWEDYQEGVKNQSAGPAPAAAGAFGAPAPAAGGFGGFGATTQPAATGFGAAAPANPFGTTASAPAFGTTTAPAFGAAASQPSLFGTAAAPAAASNPFGATTAAPAFGGFGAPQAAASQPSLFGTTTTTGFGAAPAPFGTTSPFGGASSAASFSFTSSPSTFGAASAPATSLFGTAPASSPFGGTTSTLGAVGSPFGAASSASAFGNSTFGAFGATAAKPASPFAPTTTTPFGTTAPVAAGGSLFGTAPFGFASQPASSPSIFGNAGTASTMSFGSTLFGQQTAPAATGGFMGGTGATVAMAQPPTVAQPAYGNFGALPSVPEVKVGITTRAARNTSISSGASKASPLLSLRPTPLRYGASVRTRTEQPSGLGIGGASALPPSGPLAPATGGISLGGSDLLTPQVPSGVGSTAAAAAVAAAAAGGTGLLPLRQNPHRLFIAAPPPSTEAAGGSSFLSPARPPSAQRGATPDGTGGDDVGHVDVPVTETPAGRHGPGMNGFANGYAAAGGAAAAPGAGAGPSNPAAAQGRAAAFQDAPATEPYLPRLGRLVSEGFSFSPNVDELRLLHSQNPENLAAVSNFTVSRAGVGQIRWVVPVDVRGVALYDIVSISYGEVLCYADAVVKPPQGQGLNKPAEITLYGVYKKDKETGAPIKEGPRGQAYEKALRQMCGRMGAKFLSYKLDGGVWKFEVEHFSRYGLMDIDDDEDAPVGTPAARGGPQAAIAAAAGPAPPEEGVGEAPVPRRLGLEAEGDGMAHAAQPAVAGRGLAGLGLRGFAFGGIGGPAASAAGRVPAALAAEDSGMEPSVGARWQQRQQPSGVLALPEAGGSEATGTMGPGPDQDMSEACAQLRFGDDLVADGEVSGGVVGPEVARRGGRGDGGGGGSTMTETHVFPASADGAAGPTSQPAAPLQHALPDSLAHDPVRVRALHDAFFSSTGGSAAVGVARALPAPPPQQQRLQALPGSVTSGMQLVPAAANAAGGFRVSGAAGRAQAAAAAGPAAPTAWRRPAPAIAPGAPAAVVARGEELRSAEDGIGGGGGVNGSPISLALARPVTTRPVALMTDGAPAAVLPLRDIRTAGSLTDAGLAMGRGFRVGWGPGGRLVVPGAADASSATEICITRVRVEGEGAAYGEASYGMVVAGTGAEEAEGLEALRDRLRAGLQEHLKASIPLAGTAEEGATSTEGEDVDGDGDAGAVTPAAAVPVPYWRLCIDARKLAVLVARHIRVCEQQLQQVLGGSADAATSRGGGGGGDADVDHPDALRLRHEIETWRLVETLFAKIDGEVPDPDANGVAPLAAAGEESPPPGATLPPMGAAGSPNADGADMMTLGTPARTPASAVPTAGMTTPSDYDMNDAGAAAPPSEHGAAAQAGVDAGKGPRTLLAAQQRRAALSLWLQRQARRRVEEDLQAAGSPAAVVLQLLAAHQLAASAGAAVAAGDPRLAMLVARAGSRDSARAQLATQLAVWQQSGFLDHLAPERLAAYQLLAGEVLETQRLMSLDWRRLLGLYLWYGTPNTSSPVAAMNQYMMDRHAEPAVVPHPAPYHVEGLQPSATGAAVGGGAATSGSTDVQWELMQLWATTPAAATADCLAAGQEATATGMAAAAARAQEAWLSGGGCSRLLRCAGYSPNPLDHSLAWYLMTALQAVGVLPTPGDASGGDSDEDPLRAGRGSSYEGEMLSTTLEFISQIQLAGGLCEWAVFVALTIPDLPSKGGAAVRRRVVRELLAMTVPEWSGDSCRKLFLEETLNLPTQLLAEAQATWAQYTRDDDARCAALLAAGDAAGAHDVFVASVAPALFLSGAWTELAAMVAKLEPAAAALPSWAIGGGLYGGFLGLFGRQLTAAAGAATAAAAATAAPPEGLSLVVLHEFARQVQEAQLALNAAGSAADGGPALQAPPPDEAAERSRLRRRLVLGRISARVHGALMSMSSGGTAAAAAGALAGAAAAAAAAWVNVCAGLQSGLALQGCLAAELQLGGVAVAVAEAGARVAAFSS